MRPVSLDRRSRSKATIRLCAPTRPDLSPARLSKFLSAGLTNAIAALPVARPHLHKTRRLKSPRTVSDRARANRAQPENGVGPWFDRATGGRCAQSRLAGDQSDRPLPAWPRRPTQKRSAQDLSRAATARF